MQLQSDLQHGPLSAGLILPKMMARKAKVLAIQTVPSAGCFCFNGKHVIKVSPSTELCCKLPQLGGQRLCRRRRRPQTGPECPTPRPKRNLLRSQWNLSCSLRHLLRSRWSLCRSQWNLLCSRRNLPCSRWRLLCSRWRLPCSRWRLPCSRWRLPCSRRRLLCSRRRLLCSRWRLPCSRWRLPCSTTL